MLSDEIILKKCNHIIKDFIVEYEGKMSDAHLKGYEKGVINAVKAIVGLLRTCMLASTSHIGTYKHGYKRGILAFNLLLRLGIIKEISVKVSNKDFNKKLYYLTGYEDLIKLFIERTEQNSNIRFEFEFEFESESD